jgi:DNA-directed RNA polymerase I, II, and III subunit RPABC1
MSGEDSALDRYFRMHRTVTQMLRDRGYNVNRDLVNMDKEAFRLTFPDVATTPQVINMTCHHENPSIPPMKVKFDSPDERFVRDDIRALVNEMQQDQVSRCILILKEGTLTPMTRKSIDKLAAESRLHVEIFTEKEVLINITEHELVPEHIPLSADDKKELLAKYGLEESHLPKILRHDPVVRYLGVQPGTVLKITRKSETAGRYVTYRLVC